MIEITKTKLLDDGFNSMEGHYWYYLYCFKLYNEDKSKSCEYAFYMLLNEFGEVCCLDGEECMIDHIVAGTEDVFDLVNNNGETSVHFMLSKNDLGIAVFR